MDMSSKKRVKPKEEKLPIIPVRSHESTTDNRSKNKSNLFLGGAKVIFSVHPTERVNKNTT